MHEASCPEDVEVEDTYHFLLPHLSGVRRVLDVGCGNGFLARRLCADGLEVTALDRSFMRTERTPGIRFVEEDFLGFEDAPYEALVFSSSMHHLSPLAGALATAERLLEPGGLLLVCDFDVEAPDEATARWYYDVKELLLAGGLYRPEKVRGQGMEDVRARWNLEHEHNPPLHTGSALTAGVQGHFSLQSTSHGPYLFRNVVGGLESTSHGVAIARWVLATEKKHIAAGVVLPVGLRLWARKAKAH